MRRPACPSSFPHEVVHVPIRFAKGSTAVLTTLQIPADLIAAELKEMRDAKFATTTGRNVFGTMNDYAIYIDAALHHEVGVGLHTLSLKLVSVRTGRSEGKPLCPSALRRGETSGAFL